MDELPAKKSLGQHWLRDEKSLQAIVKAAKVSNKNTILEIGPGLGTLTRELIKVAHKVITVELDEVLAARLVSDLQALNLVVHNQDILHFNFSELPADYKIVANIPYYITGHLLRIITESTHQPETMVLLLQKEVAERLVAKPGDMNIIAASVQLDFETKLGMLVPAGLFTPPPKVDSQIIIFKKRSKPLFNDLDKRAYIRLVKAGFSSPRKKLRSSLAAGLMMEKGQVDELLRKAKISGDLRAQNLSLQDWHKIYKELVI